MEPGLPVDELSEVHSIVEQLQPIAAQAVLAAFKAAMPAAIEAFIRSESVSLAHLKSS